MAEAINFEEDEAIDPSTDRGILASPINATEGELGGPSLVTVRERSGGPWAPQFFLKKGYIGADHHAHETGEIDLGCPAKLRAGLRRVSN